MAVKIRLARFGSKNNPHYRVAVADSRNKRDGKVIEYIGTYDPANKKDGFKIQSEKFEYWILQGAQVSDTVSGLVKKIK